MRRGAILACAAALSACAAPPTASIYRELARTTPHEVVARPDFPGYGRAIGRQPIPWTPASLSSDFRKLMFYTEWGDRVPRLLRWERPVEIGLVSPELVAYRSIVAELLGQIRTSAPDLQASIVLGRPADISLRSAPRAAMTAIAEEALCFFVPIAADWPEFVAAHEANAIDWAALDAFENVTIFIPANAAPHEIRSCILEEVTQALGPGNDLSALADSIYNDDNAHVWPTSFDLLMLRVLYDPALATGQDEAAAASAAYEVLRRLNAPRFGPQRRTINVRQRGYDEAIAEAIGAGPIAMRERAARRAIKLASGVDEAGHRLGEAFKTAAYVAFEKGDPGGVIANLLAAEEAHSSRLAPTSPHLARVRSELAINLINLDEAEAGLNLLNRAIPVFAANGIDWQLTHALRWRALALSTLGRDPAARQAALEAVAWARYIYGGESRAAEAWRMEFIDIGIVGGTG